MDCINLRKHFGTRYRVSFDPSYDPKSRPQLTLDPWMMVIRCRYGEIYPEGGEFLRVDIDGHNRLARRVGTIAGCELVQDGDVEKTFRFHVDQFTAVARNVRPWRRQQFTPQQRERMRLHASQLNQQKPRNSPVPVSRTHEKAAT